MYSVQTFRRYPPTNRSRQSPRALPCLWIFRTWFSRLHYTSSNGDRNSYTSDTGEWLESPFLLDFNSRLDVSQRLSRELLNGIDFLHSHRIIHRDLKVIATSDEWLWKFINFSSHLAIKFIDIESGNSQGNFSWHFFIAFFIAFDYFQIADFGLAKTYDFEMRLTSVVVTLWYRSPEILLCQSYNSAVDIWSGKLSLNLTKS